jgi:hydroxymethylglutaryl-CoA synthase
LIKTFKIDPKSIALLIVGTETGIDHSKPVSGYIHQILGLSSECRAFEIKHACYGGMAGVAMATHYLSSCGGEGKKALVIASDIARYGKETPGEPTQGGGATAILISENPRLLEIDYKNEGYFSKNVMDFWRPLYSKEAFADGHYSIQCYLEALGTAYQMHRKNVLTRMPSEKSNRFSERYAACLYHVPFVKMALKAHQKVLEIDAEKKFEKDSPELKYVLQDHEARVAPWTELNARVGNVYTASLFFSLINLLEEGKTLAGKRISLFSYGSGCAAEFMGAQIVEGANQHMKVEPFQSILDRRKSLSVSKYEAILEACSKMDLNNSINEKAEQWRVNRSVLYLGTQDHKRVYSVDGKVLI